jgi:hypothetical protein
MPQTEEDKAAAAAKKAEEKAAAEAAKEAAATEKEAEKAAKAAEKAGTTSVRVFTNAAQGGQYVRTYSADEHGPDFVKLAEQFAAKKGYEVRK